MDVDAVAKALGLGSRYEPWLRALDEVEPLPTFALPAGDAAADLLERLDVPEIDVEPVLSVWPDPARDVELWWLLERCHARFAAHMGDGDAFVECPSCHAALDLRGRCFSIFAFRRWSTRRAPITGSAVSPTTSRGQRSRISVVSSSCTGIGGAPRDSICSGEFGASSVGYALGRLQFHLYHLRCGIAGPSFWLESDEPGFRAGDATLGVHIPTTGPLTPVACDESFTARDASYANTFLSTTPSADLHIVAPRRAVGGLPPGRLEHGAVPATVPRRRRGKR